MPPNDESLRSRHRSTQSSQEKSKPKPASKRGGFSIGPMITLLVVSTAMLTLPLSTYFGIRLYIVDSTTIAAMGAIVMVQIIIAGYIYKAWQDENKDQDGNVSSKSKKS